MNEAGLLEALNDLIVQSNILVAGKPLFRHIDVWNSQIKYEKNGQGYSFQTPAIFIEMKQDNSVILGKGYEISNYQVIFHIVDTQLNNGNNLDRNLKVFGLRNLVKKKFNLYAPVQMGKLMFMKDEQDFDHDNLYHFKLTYKGALIDSYGNTMPIAGTASANVVFGFTGYGNPFGVGFDYVIGPTFSGEPPLQVYP